jgi:hypothetical protein
MNSSHCQQPSTKEGSQDAGSRQGHPEEAEANCELVARVVVSDSRKSVDDQSTLPIEDSREVQDSISDEPAVGSE